MASCCLAPHGSTVQRARLPRPLRVQRPPGHAVPAGQPCQAVRLCPERQTRLGLMPPLSHACDWGCFSSHPCDSPLERPPASPACSLSCDRSGVSPWGCSICVIPARHPGLPWSTETDHGDERTRGVPASAHRSAAALVRFVLSSRGQNLPLDIAVPGGAL
jgi:hypothetical protein